MTAEQLASMLRARKTGRERWVAKCPAHPDRNPSLAIAEGRSAVLIRCMSAGCSTEAILSALGLRWADLFRGKVTPATRLRLTEDAYLDALERRMGLLDMMTVLEPQKRNYWSVAVDRTEQEIIQLRVKLYPGKRLPIRFRGQRIERGTRKPWLISL